MRQFVSLVAIFLMTTAAVPRLQAQTTHAASQSALDAAVQQHIDTTAADREAVLRVLGHSEVKGVAARAGIDLRRATGAVSTLQGEDLARVAAQAQQVEKALAGGQSKIVISTTMIIVALLVLILIIVAVD
jgi:hypothetical protein